MLMLEHKRLPYRRFDAITLLHPIVARLHGFDAGGQTRRVGARRPLAVRLGDLLGTVPGLACDDERISTNYRIARFLDARHPDPPLFPSDPVQRATVEEAERWGNDKVQMEARRVLGGAMLEDGPAFARTLGDGRLGCLLFRHALPRQILIPTVIGRTFAISPAGDRELIAELPKMLDRIDAWIDDGVLGGEQPNAADYMLAPSLALMLYRPDVRPIFEGRPTLALVDRLLPDVL
jgi:glutathione S-transferase